AIARACAPILVDRKCPPRTIAEEQEQGERVSGVSLTGVSKRFGDTQVFDNLSLEIPAGEFVVFLGPSGCGKSTLLRMIAGLESIHCGEIRSREQCVDTLLPCSRNSDLVFPQYALNPYISVRQNLAFGLRNAGVAAGEIRRRIDEVAQRLN